MPSRARRFIYVIAACAFAVLLAGLINGLDWPVVIVLGAVSVVIEHATPAVRSYGKTNISMHMTLPISLAAGLLGGPYDAAFVAVLTCFSSVSVEPLKRLFNASNFVLSAFTAGLVLAAWDAPQRLAQGTFDPLVVVAVVLAGTAYCLVNALVLATALKLAEGVAIRQVILGAILHTAPSYIGYGILGLLIAVLWGSLGPIGGLLVLLPLVVARWAFSQYAQEQEAYEATIRTLVQAVETKDHYTRGHSERVAKASVMIARVLGISEDRVTALRYAGILHDVGKLGVPTKILQKTSGLSDDEFAMIQTHPLRGTEMLQEIEFLDEAFKGILHHHERVDGLGYPAGLRGAEIPEFARVIAVADAFDSMTSTRSYRGARTPEDAVGEIERCRGTQFDPIMVDALVQALHREPWESTTLDPPEDDADLVPILDHDDPTVDVVAGRERDR